MTVISVVVTSMLVVKICKTLDDLTKELENKQEEGWEC